MLAAPDGGYLPPAVTVKGPLGLPPALSKSATFPLNPPDGARVPTSGMPVPWRTIGEPEGSGCRICRCCCDGATIVAGECFFTDAVFNRLNTLVSAG